MMRKIDSNTHRRFIVALEAMISDMDSMGFTANADDLVVSLCELEDIFRKYNLKIEELNSLIGDYYDLFEEKHAKYVEANRLRQKEKNRIKREETEEGAETKIIQYEAKRIITA